ncbi:MAG: LURP-one-related family protein [Lachnospiraceae bacterium]|nr:LURP-one-related family protein [Lachnospiraceae bacterium]
MGTFSKVHRFHEQGTDPNINNMVNYGEPAYSLYTSTKVFSLHHRIEITDDNGNICYRSASKFFSLHDRTTLEDASGRHIADISRAVLTLHERHFVTMFDGTYFEISNELFHLVRDVTNIEGLGWQLQGNILGLNFELLDADGSIIAIVSQKMLSIHDKYCIDIYRPELEPYIIAILVALQHMISDRDSSSSSGGSGGGGGGGR